MNVLRKEVWYGILGAVIVVSFLLWGLDRFSPYSYYNNKEAYPEGEKTFKMPTTNDHQLPWGDTTCPVIHREGFGVRGQSS